MKTDAFNYVVITMLSQKEADEILRFITFLSKKMSPAECNYDIYDKELMIIVRAFEEWHSELVETSIEDSIQVISNHKNL